MLITEKRIVDEFWRLPRGVVWTGQDRPHVRLLDRGCVAIQAPAQIEGVSFRLDGTGSAPAGVFLENWYDSGVTPDPVQTEHHMLPGSRHLVSPDTIVLRGCEFISSVPWAEGANGLIAMMWVNGLHPDGLSPKPFRVIMEDCQFNGKQIALMCGHPSYGGLNRHVDIWMNRTRIQVNLTWPTGMEPNDPNAAVIMCSRGTLDMIDCSVSMTRPAYGRDVSCNLVSCTDGVLWTRLGSYGMDGGLSYVIRSGASYIPDTSEWLNAAMVSGLRGAMSPGREHSRNAALAFTGPCRLEGTLTDAVVNFARAESVVSVSEELHGRIAELSCSEGWTHGTSAESAVARRWVDVHP